MFLCFNTQFPTPDTPDAWTSYYGDVSDIWRRTFNNVNQDMWDDFEDNGGFYEVKLLPGLTLISLNTNLWYKSNKYVVDLDDPSNQFR